MYSSHRRYAARSKTSHEGPHRPSHTSGGANLNVCPSVAGGDASWRSHTRRHPRKHQRASFGGGRFLRLRMRRLIAKASAGSRRKSVMPPSVSSAVTRETASSLAKAGVVNRFTRDHACKQRAFSYSNPSYVSSQHLQPMSSRQYTPRQLPFYLLR